LQKTASTPLPNLNKNTEVHPIHGPKYENACYLADRTKEYSLFAYWGRSYHQIRSGGAAFCKRAAFWIPR
jgi:hypothetical protein